MVHRVKFVEALNKMRGSIVYSSLELKNLKGEGLSLHAYIKESLVQVSVLLAVMNFERWNIVQDLKNWILNTE